MNGQMSNSGRSAHWFFVKEKTNLPKLQFLKELKLLSFGELFT